MVPPIQRLTLAQFAALLASATLTRRITSVHLHHTWRPRHSGFRGLRTIEAMRRYHLGLGWSDIAQHLTIDPAGACWTGRNWNAPPASNAGDNGSAAAGPFMIEMIGDFDLGADVLDGAQRAAVVEVIARLLRTFALAPDGLHFHRELGSPKTCPGSGVDKAALVTEIAAAVAALTAVSAPKAARSVGARRRRAPFTVAATLGFEVTREWSGEVEDRTVPESLLAAGSVDELATVSGAGAVTREVDEWALLRPHVINLTRGRLSQSGRFRMAPGALEGIIDAFRDYAATVDEPRLMLHAHGGLVSETAALAYAQSATPWWMGQGGYPVFFVWETGLFEIILQRLGRRGVLGDARDWTFEQMASLAASWAWADMKESARLASSTDTGEGHPGGAHLFAVLLKALAGSMPAGKRLALHLVGHSVGAIFHSHFVPELVSQGLGAESLSLLAPAVRNDLFAAQVVPLFGQTPGVGAITMCTMTEDAERDDDLIEFLGAAVYGKSLLYLVSRGFEPKRKTPILGLEQTLRADPVLWAFFNGGGARLELSQARGHTPNPATEALRHGCFDNDAATMRTIASLVAGVAPSEDFPRDAACESADQRRRALGGASPLGPTGTPADVADGTDGDTRAPGRRRALCIGIDHYPTSPLAGCVADARAWKSALGRLGFTVSTLLDRDATRDRILDALTNLVTTARPGDVLAFQYSGHGTQVADLDGDEQDGFDEAFVPVDFETGALLLDDDLADVYRQLPPGARLTLFMDCCHSGTNSRFAPREVDTASARVRRRFLPLSPWQEQAHRAFRSRLPAGATRAGSTVMSGAGVVHLAACLDHQYAYEVDGAGNFTRVATAALADAVERGETNEAFAERVAHAVGALGNPQTPSLMRLPTALRNQPLLGGGHARPAIASTGEAEAPPPGPAADTARAVAYHLAEALRLLGGRS